MTALLLEGHLHREPRGSEDGFGGVDGGVGALGDEVLDLVDHVRHLGGEAEPRVGGEPVEQVVASAPFSRISSATATACSLIASCATSRPTPWRTAAMSTLVVARNGR
jgi:hypothetical protein